MQPGHEEVALAPEERSSAPELEELILDESSFFAQEMMVRLKRNMERMMSICLTWFPIGGLGEPKLYQNMWCFTRMWGFYLECLWLCEELVGVTHRR